MIHAHIAKDIIQTNIRRGARKNEGGDNTSEITETIESSMFKEHGQIFYKYGYKTSLGLEFQIGASLENVDTLLRDDPLIEWLMAKLKLALQDLMVDFGTMEQQRSYK